MMEQKKAKELVIRAGLELVRSGLIARTWGNVSCRIDDTAFAVTPSGRSYETLTPDDIVLCKVSDVSYEGNVKPSSEKGIHALVYRTHPDIGFVIHTHQPGASAVSISGIGKIPPLGRGLLGDGVPIAEYGLPGTKKLRNGVAEALENCTGRAVIMAHHGALCFGRNYEETFAAAQQLEEACFEFLHNVYLKKSGASVYEQEEFFRFYTASLLETPAQPQIPLCLYSSRRTEDGFVLEDEPKTACRFDDTDISEQAKIHREIYQKRADIRFIVQDTGGGLLAVSRTYTPLLPWLDDFAQIAGKIVNCAESTDPDAVMRALHNRMGVLVPNGGALCCAATQSDANALQLVMEKDALAQMSARLLGGGRTLGLFDCQLMHFVYTKSYSKRAKRSSVQG